MSPAKEKTTDLMGLDNNNDVSTSGIPSHAPIATTSVAGENPVGTTTGDSITLSIIEPFYEAHIDQNGDGSPAVLTRKRKMSTKKAAGVGNFSIRTNRSRSDYLVADGSSTLPAVRRRKLVETTETSSTPRGNQFFNSPKF
jgi:hypothetical protein